jgi:hypothetical protein
MEKLEENKISFDIKGTSKHKTLKTVLITIAAYTIIFNMLFGGYMSFYNINTKDRGLSFLLRDRVYDTINYALKTIHLDDNGGIPDVKVPFTSHCWITFDVE